MIARQIRPYVFVAGLCVVAHFLILNGGDWLGMHFVLSTTVSFISCVLIGYGLHSRWTFTAQATFSGLLRYTLAMALNLPLSILAVWVFSRLLQLPMVLAAPGSTLALTGYNFFLSRWAFAGDLQANRNGGAIRESD